MTSHLEALERVDLSDTDIHTIDEAMQSISKTTNYLNLQSNMISHLSLALDGFTKLTVLDLSHNQLVSIESISLLENLQTLGLANNNLTTESINESNLPNLHNLQKINLNGNEITEFPISLCHIKQLTHLGLADNFIEEIPHEITDLLYLCYLSLKNNQIQKCNVDFTKLMLLKGVSLVGNPVIETEARAYVRLFHHVPLLQQSETTVKSNISLNEIE